MTKPTMTKPQIRVLIVEDDLVDRMACRRALAQDPDYEFVLSEAETGREGLRLAHAQKPDCVLLDYHLPDLNGLEFLAELRNELDEIPVPVMMLTGADNASVAVEAMKRGAQDYLVKDVNRQYLELLPAVIQRVLRKQQLLAEKKAAEAKYRTLVEQIPVITYIATLDEEGSTLYISPQIRNLGFSQEEWLAAPGIHLKQIHSDDRVRVMELFAKSRTTGSPLRCEYRLRARNRSILWVRDEAVVVQDDGRPVVLQGIMVDITQSKQMEEELREHRNYLEELVEERTDSLMRANESLRQYIDELELAKSELMNDKELAEASVRARNGFPPISSSAQKQTS